jgi:hypothetical protein
MADSSVLPHLNSMPGHVPPRLYPMRIHCIHHCVVLLGSLQKAANCPEKVRFKVGARNEAFSIQQDCAKSLVRTVLVRTPTCKADHINGTQAP